MTYIAPRNKPHTVSEAGAQAHIALPLLPPESDVRILRGAAHLSAPRPSAARVRLGQQMNYDVSCGSFCLPFVGGSGERRTRREAEKGLGGPRLGLVFMWRWQAEREGEHEYK